MFLKFAYLTFFLQIVAFPLVAQKEIAFIADMQRPLAIELLFSKDEQNERATDSLRAYILQRKPATLFLLGDMVARGSTSNDWAATDSFCKALTQKNIPYQAITGNHEYLFDAKKGKENFEHRFGRLADNVRIQNIDSIAVVMLNSNFDKLSNKETNRMLLRYATVMDSLQESNNIRCIIVATHHSPFTNSKTIKPSQKVENLIIPKYLATRKAVLFLSGHAHLAELFKEKGKYFCVIGGGGGCKQRVWHKPRYDNLLKDNIPFRFFYCTVRLNAGFLHLDIHSLNVGRWSEESMELLKLSIN